MQNYKSFQFLIPAIPFNKSIMSHGKGSYLYDTEGQKYLDLNAGQFCTVLGHSNSEIMDCIWKSAETLVHTSTSIISSEVLSCAKNLHRISGDMKASCILLSTGAEVVEFCLRYAKCIQQKNGIVCFDKGYHGLTLGAQSITFSGIYAKPNVQETYTIPLPEDDKSDLSLKNVEILFKNNEIAAIILEPIVSVGGMIFPSAEWFHKVRELCDQYQVLLVLDECQTGFGRTGNWFAYQTYNFIPDMVATAKGIGLGFPVAIAMFRDKLIPQENRYPITHYSSHQNDSLSAAIINIGIEYIEKHSILTDIQVKAVHFLQQLKKLEQRTHHVKNARGCGLMLGIDLFYENTNDYRNIYDNIYRKMMGSGVIIQGTNGGRTLRFLPDYLITHTDIEFAIEQLYKVLQQQRPVN